MLVNDDKRETVPMWTTMWTTYPQAVASGASSMRERKKKMEKEYGNHE